MARFVAGAGAPASRYAYVIDPTLNPARFQRLIEEQNYPPDRPEQDVHCASYPRGERHQNRELASEGWRSALKRAPEGVAEHLSLGGMKSSMPSRRREIGTGLSAGAFSPTERSSVEKSVVSVLAWIIVGIIAGWLAEHLMGRSHGLLTNMIVGLVGSLVGGFVFSSVMGFHYSEGFNVASIVVATVGAIILLAIFGGVRNRRTWS